MDGKCWVHPYFIAIVHPTSAGIGLWLPLEHFYCPSTALHAEMGMVHALALLWGTQLSYFRVQMAGAQKEGKWRSQNHCWAQAERPAHSDFTRYENMRARAMLLSVDTVTFSLERIGRCGGTQWSNSSYWGDSHWWCLAVANWWNY